jgi:hypothetical protein
VRNLFNIPIAGTALLASASVAMSQDSQVWIDGHWHGGQWDAGAFAQMYPQYGETGPYPRSGLGAARSGQTQRHPTMIPFSGRRSELSTTKIERIDPPTSVAGPNDDRLETFK